MLIYATIALIIGFLLDLLIGDPPNWPHIVRKIGQLIMGLEKYFYPLKSKRRGGLLLTLSTVFICTLIPALLSLTYNYAAGLYLLIETFLCWQLLATRSLQVESDKVYKALSANDLPLARQHLSMIVGRDTNNLNAEDISKATVETIAENTADGVVAPLFYLMLGGATLGVLYKTVNTLDSMIGYKNEDYLEFGSFAARLDDIFNFIPARLTAFLMLGSAYLSRKNASKALYIWKRDRFNHASPNSAQSEAVVAGALQIQLGGPAYYQGVLQPKPYIGDDIQPIAPEHIGETHQLLYITALFMFFLALLVRGIFYVVL